MTDRAGKTGEQEVAFDDYTPTSDIFDSLLTDDHTLLAVYHRDENHILRLIEGHSIVLGRESSADLALADPTLSRKHVRFEMIDHKLWVIDLESTNGTRVNGTKVQRCMVHPGDVVTLGSVSVCLYAEGTQAVVPQLQGHDKLVDVMDREVARAQSSHQTVGLMMVRSVDPTHGHVGSWVPRLRSLLDEMDHLALYGPNTVEVFVTNTTPKKVQALADRIVQGRRGGEPLLVCGVALFPEQASCPEELIERSNTALQQTTVDLPVKFASGRTAMTEIEATKRADGSEAPIICSPKMTKVFETVDRLAKSVIPVLICGETGVGKEVIASAIHQRGPRRKRPLRCVNCGGIPEHLAESALFGHEAGAFTGAHRQARGVFEEADGGTVLLDEIGELPLSAQAALLRVLENNRFCRVGSTKEIEVDVRILAATHRDLEQMCEQQTFRWDLFYRLNTMTLLIPPLRERPEEIMPLAELFIQQANALDECAVHAVDDSARDILMRYDWPGNVRELRNAIQRAVVIVQLGTIGASDLPRRVRDNVRAAERPSSGPWRQTINSTMAQRHKGVTQRKATVEVSGFRPNELEQYEEDNATILIEPEGDVDFKQRIRHYEEQLIRRALQESAGNKSEAARRLKMPRRTLAEKIRVYGITGRWQDG